MDRTKRKITKIARNAGRFAKKALKDTNLGSTEYELLKNVVKNPGITQKSICKILDVDKSSVTRMVSNLVKKGYIITKNDENDSRFKNLFSAEDIELVIRSSIDSESLFYEWLTADIEPDKLDIFIEVLNRLHIKSKNERHNNFESINKASEKNRIKFKLDK